MNRTHLISGLVMAATVVLTFTSCNKLNQKPASTQVTEPTTSGIKNGKIAYVEIDSIFSHYEMAKDLKASLENKQKQLEADFNSKQRNFQTDVVDFQNKAQKGLMTQTNAQEVQKQLTDRQQQLYQLQDKYRSDIAEEAQVNQRKIIQSIMNYLKTYNHDKGYQYILAYTFPSSILLADSTMNITNEVIPGLNGIYKKEGDKKEKSK